MKNLVKNTAKTAKEIVKNEKFVANEDVLNKKKALKYVSKQVLIDSVIAANNYLCANDEKFTVKEHDYKTASKLALIDEYAALVAKIKNLKPAKAGAPASKEKAEVAKVQPAKAVKVANKPEARKTSEEGAKGSALNAQSRFTKYSAELEEKTKLLDNGKVKDEDAKALKHRIASLKRKIARAEKSLNA